MRVLYMWGSVPSSLLRGLTSLWMAQDSSRHLLEVWDKSELLASSQLMGCPVEWECSAKAEVARSQLRTDLWCSLILWLRVLLVCPMYVGGQFLQGIWYIKCNLSSFGTCSFGCTRSWCNVLVRWKVVLMPKGSGFVCCPLRYSSCIVLWWVFGFAKSSHVWLRVVLDEPGRVTILG